MEYEVEIECNLEIHRKLLKAFREQEPIHFPNVEEGSFIVMKMETIALSSKHNEELYKLSLKLKKIKL
jgi:hypothetical protein